MKLEYSLTEKDLLAFNRYDLAKSPTAKKTLFNQRIAFSIIYLIPGLIGAVLTDYVFSFIFLFLSVLWWFLYPLYFKKYQLSKIKKFIKEKSEGLLKSPIVLELRDNGLFSKSFLGETNYNYAALEIEETEQHAFIYVGKGAAIIMPKDTIGDKVVEKFIAKLKTSLTSV